MMGERQAPVGGQIIDSLVSAGIEFVVAVPDIVTSDGLLWPISRRADLKLIRVCKEDEGVSICAGLSVCRRRAVLLMQQTGLMDSLNAIRAIAKDYEQPICMIVGLQGKEPDLLPEQSRSYGVRIVRPILDVMEIEHHLVQDADDCGLITPAIAQAYGESRPVCILIGRSPS